MRPTLIVILTVLTAAMFAGCVDEAAPVDVSVSPLPGSTGQPAAASDPRARPTWTHGDWFEYSMFADFGFGTLIDNQSAKLVVIRSDARGYELAPDHRNFGVVDAHFDDFFIGPLTTDLHGIVGFNKKLFKMFQWPLRDQATWSTDFEALSITASNTDPITVSAQEVRAVKDPKGESLGFILRARTENGFNIEYEYSAAVKWITRFVRADPNGKTQFSMHLRDYGGNYTGPIHVVTKEDLLEKFAMVPPFFPGSEPIPPALQFQVTKDYTFVQEVMAAFTFSIPPATGGGAAEILAVYPDNSNFPFTHSGVGNTFKVYFRDMEPPKKGGYTIQYALAGTIGVFMAYYGFTDQVIEFTKQSHANH